MGPYINNKGEVVIKPLFDWVGDFQEGLARVQANDQYGFIDKNGKVVYDSRDRWKN